MDRKNLHTMLGLEVNPASPCFIIYSEEISPRLNYVVEFIFKHVLKVNISVTNSVSEFGSSSFFKINYSKTEITGSFQISPVAFLFEKIIGKNMPEPVLKNGLVYFFENEGMEANTNVKYDIFAAVFYFISRYEEWQSFETDAHGRFEAQASILFKNNLHLKPVVDIWILELKSELESFYQDLKFPKNNFKVISTIDVDNLYAYKAKGFLRTTGSIFKDLLKCDVANLKRRLSVLRNKEKDPFDIYSAVSEFCADKNIALIYFLFRNGNKYDRTVDPRSHAFAEVSERIRKHQAIIGLHPSYYSSEDKNLLRQEVQAFSKSTGLPINLSRQHYLRFDIKTTPSLLIENGIIADFTMGFASVPGFRAGTSFPFYYFNFNTNKQNDLLMVPFCAMDGAYFIYDKTNPEKMLSSLKDLAAEVKKVNGLFISVFHERTFSNHLYPGYDRIYNNFHQTLNAL